MDHERQLKKQARIRGSGNRRVHHDDFKITGKSPLHPRIVKNLESALVQYENIENLPRSRRKSSLVLTPDPKPTAKPVSAKPPPLFLVSSPGVLKKGRGRPRKHPKVEPMPGSRVTLLEQGVKRKRGRPPKNRSGITETPPRAGTVTKTSVSPTVHTNELPANLSTSSHGLTDGNLSVAIPAVETANPAVDIRRTPSSQPKKRGRPPKAKVEEPKRGRGRPRKNPLPPGKVVKPRKRAPKQQKLPPSLALPSRAQPAQVSPQPVYPQPIQYRPTNQYPTPHSKIHINNLINPPDTPPHTAPTTSTRIELAPVSGPALVPVIPLMPISAPVRLPAAPAIAAASSPNSVHAATAPVTAPVKRGRGRPRKNPIVAKPPASQFRPYTSPGTANTTGDSTNGYDPVYENGYGSGYEGRAELPKKSIRERRSLSRTFTYPEPPLSLTEKNSVQKPLAVDVERLANGSEGCDKRLKLHTLDVIRHLAQEYLPQPTNSMLLNESILQENFKIHLVEHLDYLKDTHAAINDISKTIQDVQKQKNEMRNQIYQIRQKHLQVGHELNRLRESFQHELSYYERFANLRSQLEKIQQLNGDVDEGLEEMLQLELLKAQQMINPQLGIYNKLVKVNEKLKRLDEELQ